MLGQIQLNDDEMYIYISWKKHIEVNAISSQLKVEKTSRRKLLNTSVLSTKTSE